MNSKALNVIVAYAFFQMRAQKVFHAGVVTDYLIYLWNRFSRVSLMDKVVPLNVAYTFTRIVYYPDTAKPIYILFF